MSTTKHLRVGKYLACGENPSSPHTEDINQVTCKDCFNFAPPGACQQIVSEPTDTSEPSFQDQQPSEAFYG